MAKLSYDHTTAAGQKRMMYESIGFKVERLVVDLSAPGDYGCDPVGDGTFRMVPSGDVVDLAERNKRLKSI